MNLREVSQFQERATMLNKCLNTVSKVDMKFGRLSAKIITDGRL